MPRLLQLLVLTFTASLLAAVVLVPGCGNECNKKEDCPSRNVCLSGVCTPASAEYVSCDTNKDCDPTGAFICKAGRCVAKQTGGFLDASTHLDATSTTTQGRDASVAQDI